MKLNKNTNLIGLKMMKIFNKILCFNKCGNKWEETSLTNKLNLKRRKNKWRKEKSEFKFLIKSKVIIKKNKFNWLE